ncbi:hypothetical protein pb186bvf_012752 [Paramecium bursaria]
MSDKQIVISANKLQERGQFLQAIELYDKVDEIDAHFNKGLAFIQLKEYEKAHQSFNIVILKDPQITLAYYNKGLIYMEQNVFQKALDNFEICIEQNRNNSDFHNYRGLALQKLKRFDEAERAYNNAIKINKKNSQAYFNRAKLFAIEGRQDEALSQFDLAIKMNNSYFEAYNEKGLIYLEQKQFQQSLESFEESLNCNKNYLDALINKAKVYQVFKCFSKELKCYDEYLAKVQTFDVYLLRGQVYQNLGDYNQAIVSYRKASLLNPNSIETLQKIATSFEKIHNFQQAMEWYQLILAKEPQNIQSLMRLGQLYIDFKQLEEAKINFQKIIDFDPNNIQAQHLLGSIERLQGNNQQALQIYNTVVKLDPKCSEIYCSIGDIHLENSNYSDALKAYDKALENNQNNIKAQVNKGIVYYREDMFKKAKECFDIAIERDPNFIFAYLEKGKVLLRQQNYDKAFENYNKALLVQPNNTEILIQTSKVLFVLDKPDEAKEKIKLAQQNLQNNNQEQEILSIQNEIDKVLAFENKLLQLESQISNPVIDCIQQDILQTQVQTIKKQRSQIYIKDKKESQKLDFEQLQTKIDDLSNRVQDQFRRLTIYEQKLALIEDFLGDQLAIQKQLNQLSNQKDGFKYLAYYRGFYWMLLNYLSAIKLLGTGFIKIEQRAFIETTQEQIQDAAIKVSGFSKGILGSIPYMRSCFSMIESALSTHLSMKIDRKIEDRSKRIMSILQNKCSNESELEVIIAKSCLKIIEQKSNLILSCESRPVKAKFFKQLFETLKDKYFGQVKEFRSSFAIYGQEDALLVLLYYYTETQTIIESFQSLDILTANYVLLDSVSQKDDDKCNIF